MLILLVFTRINRHQNHYAITQTKIRRQLYTLWHWPMREIFMLLVNKYNLENQKQKQKVDQIDSLLQFIPIKFELKNEDLLVHLL